MLDKVILAADEITPRQLLSLVPELAKRGVYAVKIHDMFDLHGADIVKQLHEAGVERVWIDVKLHDIPNTVRRRADALYDVGADIITVHASGHIEMMQAAIEAFPHPRQIFAVTILTSLDGEQVKRVYRQSTQNAVVDLMWLATDAGVDGVVCSPEEVGELAHRAEMEGMKLVVPGVRPSGGDPGDQKRVSTPINAIKAGATHIVIGRPITRAADSIAALDALEAELNETQP